jgi:hypothetical protein
MGFASSILCVPIVAIFSAWEGLFDLRRELLAIPAIGIGIGAGKLFTMLMTYLNYNSTEPE